MLFRTHLTLGVFAALVFLPVVSNPIQFFIITVIASLLPDIDTAFSKVGRNPPAKVVQVFTEHRGMLHSLTLAVVIAFVLSLFFPKFAFGFFIGFSVHLLADSFTKQGITPFWPYSRKAHGVIGTGGVVEKGIFAAFVLVDVLLVGLYLL
jgi:inner membrane protein